MDTANSQASQPPSWALPRVANVGRQSDQSMNRMKETTMQSEQRATPVSKTRLWAAYAITGLAVLFLTFDSVLKVFMMAPAVEGTTQLGYPASVIFGIGVVELICLVLYLVPRTSVLGAILFTGYLGGAIATHVRVGSPMFSHTLFPIYVAAMIWGGLYLRESRLRALLPFRR